MSLSITWHRMARYDEISRRANRGSDWEIVVWRPQRVRCPSGTRFRLCAGDPALKTPGYCRQSLRDQLPLMASGLLHRYGQQLRAAYHVIERGGRGFVDAGFSADDHLLVTAHAVHHVHDRNRQG